MAIVGLTAEQHARVFGLRDDLDDTGPGRSRRCRVCGGWHRLDKPWPHNCRSEPPRRADYAAPMLAPAFQPFRTGVLEGAEVIGDRRDKREYMARNDLVEYDEGVTNAPTWAEEREQEREIVADLKRFHETDPENLPPDLRAQPMDQTGSLDEGTEISTDKIEVVK